MSESCPRDGMLSPGQVYWYAGGRVWVFAEEAAAAGGGGGGEAAKEGGGGGGERGAWRVFAPGEGMRALQVVA